MNKWTCLFIFLMPVFVWCCRQKKADSLPPEDYRNAYLGTYNCAGNYKNLSMFVARDTTMMIQVELFGDSGLLIYKHATFVKADRHIYFDRVNNEHNRYSRYIDGYFMGNDSIYISFAWFSPGSSDNLNLKGRKRM